MISKATLLGKVIKIYSVPLKSGADLVIMTVLTSNAAKNQGGELKEFVSMHQVECFDKIGVIVKTHVKEGDYVFVEGNIQHAKNLEGDFVYSVFAKEVKYIPKKSKGCDHD